MRRFLATVIERIDYNCRWMKEKRNKTDACQVNNNRH